MHMLDFFAMFFWLMLIGVVTALVVESFYKK